MNTTWRVIILTGIVLLAIVKISRYISKPEGNAQTISSGFEHEWHYNGEAYELEIINVLKENSHFYNSYYLKKSLRGDGTVLVACTDDEIDFKYFKYDTRSGGNVQQIVDDGIPKPKQ
jgi:hypothetical protein